MSDVYHDAEYLNQISYKLERFKQKDRLKWNFRCPFCNDSEKSKLKARGVMKEGKHGLYYFCYNCDKNASFRDFLKFMDPGLFAQYQSDKYRPVIRDISEENVDLDLFDIELEMPEKKKVTKEKEAQVVIPIKSLDEDHFAREYLKARQIPKKAWRRISFSSKLDSLIDQKKRRPEPRIVFTCKTLDGEPFAYSGRIIPEYEGLRYKVINLTEKPLVFGMEKIDIDSKVYVVEGPVDSLFLPNCLAACCASLSSIEDILKTHEAPVPTEMVLVYDNEKRNKDIVKRMMKAVKLGFKICVWPDWVKQKDINLMVLAGLDPLEIITENTYSGLSAKHKINKWKRCELQKPFSPRKQSSD